MSEGQPDSAASHLRVLKEALQSVVNQVAEDCRREPERYLYETGCDGEQ
jgi:hypothetical protein